MFFRVASFGGRAGPGFLFPIFLFRTFAREACKLTRAGKFGGGAGFVIGLLLGEACFCVGLLACRFGLLCLESSVFSRKARFLFRKLGDASSLFACKLFKTRLFRKSGDAGSLFACKLFETRLFRKGSDASSLFAGKLCKARLFRKVSDASSLFACKLFKTFLFRKGGDASSLFACKLFKNATPPWPSWRSSIASSKLCTPTPFAWPTGLHGRPLRRLS